MGQQQGGIAGLLFPIILFVGIFYFLILRPQKKKQQQHEKMLSSINRGDTVITAGGFFGKVSDVLDDSYIIELADGVKARILKSSISVRRETSDNAPKAPRPKKKDRPRKDALDEGKSEESTAQPADEGVTNEETSALMDQTEASAPEEEAANLPAENTEAEKSGN